MAAVPVGTKVTYHSEHGDWVGFVTDYEPGRADGDYYLCGFTNELGQAKGTGVTFSRWSVDGTEQGAFTPHG